MTKQERSDITSELMLIRKGKGLNSIKKYPCHKYIMKFLKQHSPVNSNLDLKVDEYDYSIYLI